VQSNGEGSSRICRPGPFHTKVAGYFELVEDEASQIAAQVGQAVAAWRRKAKKMGITPAEIDRMASAFEHEDLKAALALVSRARANKK
jgi:hypothetical protein